MQRISESELYNKNGSMVFLTEKSRTYNLQVSLGSYVQRVQWIDSYKMVV